MIGHQLRALGDGRCHFGTSAKALSVLVMCTAVSYIVEIDMTASQLLRPFEKKNDISNAFHQPETRMFSVEWECK